MRRVSGARRSGTADANMTQPRIQLVRRTTGSLNECKINYVQSFNAMLLHSFPHVASIRERERERERELQQTTSKQLIHWVFVVI